MFIWISRVRYALAIAVALPLAGCLGEGSGEGGFGLLSQPDSSETFSAPVLSQVSVFRGNVVVAGPEGYCIDRQSMRTGGGGAFALIASCESLTGKTGMVVDPAILTVSVLPRQITAEQPSTGDLAAMAESARVLAADDGDGISLVHLSTGGDALLPDGDPRYWRGGMLINGHVVGLAVYGPKGSAVAGQQGRRLMMALAETLRTRSPVRDYTPQSASSPVDNTKKPTGAGALLGELFPESN